MENAIVFVVVGLVAGFLASRVVTGKGKGWLLDIVIGVLGAVIGGWLAGVFHLQIGYGVLGQIVIAFAGAVILLLVWGLLFGRKRRHA